MKYLFLNSKFLVFFSIIFGLSLSACNSREIKSYQNPNEVVTSQSVKPTYSSIRDNVFISKCMQCHSGSSPAAGVDLSSYSALVNNFPPIVVSGDPANSPLYTSVASGQMPKNSAPLSSNAVTAIFDWIVNGAQDN